MKTATIGVYIILAVASGFWMIASFVGNRGVEFSWRPDFIAFTFIMMTLFTISVLVLQLARPMSWWLVAQTALVSIPLVVASIYHMFPEKSIVAASAHLVLATVFFVLNVIQHLKSTA